MTRVALILSLSHSGSTLVDWLLGSHPRCVGLGEVANVLRLPAARLDRKFGGGCTCGATTDECVFWGPVRAGLAAHPEAPLDSKLDLVLRHFREVFGDDPILVDSSKKIRSLHAWARHAEVELAAIHLVKDVRSYAVSRLDRLPSGARGTRACLAAFGRWQRKNARIERRLGAAGVRHTTLGYEALCADPAHQAERLCRFLGLPFEPSMLELGGGRSHLVAGNPILREPERRGKIEYDDRWLHRDDWRWAARLRPGVMRANARLTRLGAGGDGAPATSQRRIRKM
jgi:hypothetical protein